MRLVAYALTLALLARAGFCENEMGCNPGCEDQYIRCQKKWTKQDCIEREDVLQACPVMCATCVPCGEIDGQFGDWRILVECSDNCTEGDLEVKMRDCNDPEPMHGGAFCVGSPIEVKKCEGCSKPATDDDLDDVCSTSCGFAGPRQVLEADPIQLSETRPAPLKSRSLTRLATRWFSVTPVEK